MNDYNQISILEDLTAEGYIITSEIQPCLGPFRIGHVNRIGKYDLNENKPYIEVNYGNKRVPLSDD
ncbi:hypothetical protein FCL47_17550 [Desulfopila sp. IMCC35006]|uniref:hypothetical protein n=1 Tax=Desulfopila sp. IMCC35006 TaxID=2569542 RepID=UPI0010AC3D4C|nr:hypothetical protein [Desulfopila sp. IMCC35006]TKB24637.1 hypothetical protein FCL47_17550 [Desulfopila sp. IMCC35006]